LAGIVFVLLLVIGYVVIVGYGHNTIKFNQDYFLLLISGILFSVFLIFQQYFIAQKRLIPFAISTLGVRALILIFNLASIFFFQGDIQCFILSIFCGTLVALLIVLVFSLNIFGSHLNFNGSVKELINFSLPLSLNAVISIGFTNGYRVLISTLIPLSSLAVFGLMSQIATAYYIGLTSIILPFNSAAYHYLEEKKGEANYVPSYQKRCIQLGLLGFFLTILGSWIMLKYFKGGVYFDGIKMLPILLFAQFFFVLYSHEYIVLSYFKRTSKITLASIIGVVLILTSFYPLILFFGVWGACIATLIGYLGQYLSARFFKK
jgi:O-antigen/teichoic acid export membrane protein